MENNSKFVLEEHKDNFFYKQNKSKINISFNRIAFIFFIFFIIFLIFSIHLIHLGSRKVNIENKNENKSLFNNLYRADIIDRNGNYLVKTVNSINVGISTQKIIDKKKLILNLKYIFPEKDYGDITSKIKSKKFFYFEKKISEENYEKLMRLGDKSIQSEKKLIRVYPEKNLFSHIIGQIDDDNTGISGLEQSLNEDLKKFKSPIKLTVDKNIQFLLRSELVKFNKIFNAKGSAAILMNVNNGNILSLVSLPDFDPNKREKISDSKFINRATKGVYEFGSVFKTFTLAAAFNEKIIDNQTEFVDLPKSLTCAGFPIREYDKKIPSNLTAEQILIRSGNIGSVRIAQKIGPDKFKSFLEKVGILSPITFDIEEVAPQKSYEFSKCKLATASYGHGIATTILQLAKGYAILSNGGFEIKPNLITKNSEKNKKKNRLLNKGVSEQVVSALRKIVNTEEGTAKFANVPNYEIGGKTGTADKVLNGVYSEGKVNTFASIFPTSNPKFVFVVMLDGPQKSKDYYYKYRHMNGGWKGTLKNSAGWTSVEVAGKVIDKIGPILATKYIEVN